MEAYEIQCGRQAFRIYNSARECVEQGLSEAEWNRKVHCTLLDLVTEHPRYRAKAKLLDM